DFKFIESAFLLIGQQICKIWRQSNLWWPLASSSSAGSLSLHMMEHYLFYHKVAKLGLTDKMNEIKNTAQQIGDSYSLKGNVAINGPWYNFAAEKLLEFRPVGRHYSSLSLSDDIGSSPGKSMTRPHMGGFQKERQSLGTREW
uniref:Uncharacterized protein n=1 Tax=Romanomermis culicivorax TaxID=13658 RepID=A0A915L2Q9_ROMCU